MSKPPGILSLSPRVLQCEECGVTADAATVGLPVTALKQPQLVHLLSGLRFHAHSWPDGRTDNPRLCRACRLARGCTISAVRCRLNEARRRLARQAVSA